MATLLPHRILLVACALWTFPVAVPWSAPLRAQAPLSVDVRGGAALPVGSFGSPGRAAAEAGPSLSVHFAYQRTRGRAFYAGFSRHRFGCGDGACPPDGEMVSTAWGVGSRLSLRVGGAAPWLRLGVLFDRVMGDFGPPGESVRRLSDLSLGGEVGVGVTLPLRGRLSTGPSVRYALLDTRFPEVGILRMRYLVTDLGLTLGF